MRLTRRSSRFAVAAVAVAGLATSVAAPVLAAPDDSEPVVPGMLGAVGSEPVRVEVRLQAIPAAGTPTGSSVPSVASSVPGTSTSYDIEAGDPGITAQFDGTGFALQADIGALITPILPPDQTAMFSAMRLEFETVVIGTDAYVSVPFVGLILGSMEPTEPGYDALQAMATGWASIDTTVILEAMASSGMMEELPDFSSMEGMDPSVFLDFIEENLKLTPLGTDEIDGVAVTGYRTVLRGEDLVTLVESQGDLTAQLEAELGPDTVDVDEVLDTIGDVEIPVAAWLDDQGRPVRVIVEVQADQFTGLGDAAGGMAAAPIPSEDELPFETLLVVVDFRDYGDPSIVVEAPVGAVDITSDVITMIESGGPSI